MYQWVCNAMYQCNLNPAFVKLERPARPELPEMRQQSRFVGGSRCLHYFNWILCYFMFLRKGTINHGNLLCGRLSLGNFSPRKNCFKKCVNIGIRRVKTSDFDISKAVKGSHLESLSFARRQWLCLRYMLKLAEVLVVAVLAAVVGQVWRPRRLTASTV